MSNTFDPMAPNPGFKTEEKTRREFGTSNWEDVRREGQAAGRQAKAVAERAREMAGTVKDSLTDLKHKATDRVDAVRTRSFRENAELARDQIKRHPGTAMLLSMALGLAIGKSIASASARKHRQPMDRWSR